MVSRSRWKAAQRYERGYWQRHAARIAAGEASQLDWYQWRAAHLAERLRQLGLAALVTGGSDVLEIGSGPIGVVAHVPGRTRVGVDPLEPFYRGDAVLTALRPADVRYLEGVGEDLPCGASSFDLVIVDNCIDHVRDVAAVMREIARVLRPGGTLYLTVNCRTAWGFLVHRALSRLRIDAGHPHTFTPGRLEALIAGTQFRRRAFEVESAARARRQDLLSGGLKSRLKGLVGSSEFGALLLAQREHVHHGARPAAVAVP